LQRSQASETADTTATTASPAATKRRKRARPNATPMASFSSVLERAPTAMASAITAGARRPAAS
ncbi:MAG TPA: hypothetical protein VEU52_05575, partial [Candidatus Limnocylindrales bacterium]|nr:hypothetical protein [Candidatus Limnocylindrales bacterium]